MDIRDYAARKRADIDIDAMLDRMGLQRKDEGSSMLLSALGIFGAGLAVGASLGLLFAPKPGPEIRREVTRRLPFSSESVRPNGASQRASVPPSDVAPTSHAVTGG